MGIAHVLAGRKGVGACKRRSKEHYQRMAKIAYEKHFVPQDIRFWKHVVKRDGDQCWSWIGANNPGGYGMFRWNGKAELASRIVWRLERGPIPLGMCVLHKCDNPPCCNPDHLFIGTKADNMHDMYRKGRNRALQGEEKPNHKFTRQDVILIRSTKGNRPEFARRYGVTAHAIDDIRAGRTWKHVP